MYRNTHVGARTKYPMHPQVAFVGFAVQALVTREQPIEGLTAHLADPFGHNIITNVRPPCLLASAKKCVATLVLKHVFSAYLSCWTLS